MGFTFDGISSKSMGIATRMTTENRIPDLRNNSITMAGRDGLLDLGCSLSERVIEISCFIPPMLSQEAFLQRKDEIVEWLNPKKGLCDLVLDTEPGRIYYARLQSGVSFERMVRLSATFELEFICPDPFGYATEDEVFLITSEGEHTATRVLGNLESYPIYRVNGTFESGAGNNITITTNDEELQISNVDLKPTETFVVDTSKMTAWIEDEDGNKVQNGLPYIADLNFPTLKVGNNLISVAVTNAEFTKLEIQAKSRWR